MVTVAPPPALADATDQLRALDLKDPSADADFASFESNAKTLLVDNTREHTRFVSPKDFELLKVIGIGAFGKVLQVRNKTTKKILAMKVISKRRLQRKEGYVENIQAERDILTRVNHPFVVKMHCSFQTPDKLFIIMDFLAGSELFLRLGREGIFLEGTAAFYLAEIILALDHLHSQGIIHRDLKPENILLGSDGHVCLTDFGLAKITITTGFSAEDEETRAMTICGTQEYMAPEMLSRQGYGRAADYWSLGCIAYEMLSGQPPFIRRRNESNKDLFRKIMTEKVKMPDLATAAACKLLKGLLNRSVEKRLGCTKNTMFEVGGVAALKKADFFAHIQWDKLEKKEIQPPVVLSVNDDEDLQHFHTDFTSMELPRSVVEMSRDQFRPGHVESDLFRGFSFIQEDFPLPDRGLSEIQNYWNNIAADANSDSEAASSKFDHAEEEPSIEASKKKRPPRKRKKKGDYLTSSTPAASNATTPAPSTNTTPVTSRAASPTMPPTIPSTTPVEPVLLDVLTANTQVSLIEKTTPLSSVPEAFKITSSAPTLRPQASPWRPVQNASKSISTPNSTNLRSVVTPGSSAGPSYPAWQQVKSQQTSLSDVSSGSQRVSQNRPTLHPQQIHPQVGRNIPIQYNHPIGDSASLSSDWRQHRMSPHSNTRPIIHPPNVQQSHWPSLDPPLSSKSDKTRPPLQGAWAARSKP